MWQAEEDEGGDTREGSGEIGGGADGRQVNAIPKRLFAAGNAHCQRRNVDSFCRAPCRPSCCVAEGADRNADASAEGNLPPSTAHAITSIAATPHRPVLSDPAASIGNRLSLDMAEALTASYTKVRQTTGGSSTRQLLLPSKVWRHQNRGESASAQVRARSYPSP